MRKILSALDSSASKIQIFEALERIAAEDPQIQPLLQGMRIVGPQGEVYRGSKYERKPPPPRSAEAGTTPKASVAER
jgi:hypothetical protein